MEQKTWKSSQFCNNPELSALLQHHFDGIISSIQIEYERAEKERTKLVKEVASFVNQTITLQRQRQSPLLFAMGAATAITLEPLPEKAGCRLLSIFGLCESSKRKIEQLEGRLHYLESRMVHLCNEENESIQVMASISLKLLEDTRKVLNYSEDNFEILKTNLEVLQKTMEEMEQAQACDHRRYDVFMYAFRNQSAINNVSWTLNAMHSELQVQTLYLTEQRNIFIKSIGVLSKGILPAALVPYEDLRKIITTLKLGDKKCSIPYYNSILLYSLPLVRNVFSNPHGLLITIEVPVYSGEPITMPTKQSLCHNQSRIQRQPQLNDGRNSLERNYLIVSRREETYAKLKSEESLSCLGIQLLILCNKPVALVSAQDQLCLTSLLYNHEVAALETCTREVTELPILPTAFYLGNSMYLLNAADDQQFLYNITYSGGRNFSNRVAASKSCLVHPPAMENWFTRTMNWSCCPIQHIVFNKVD